MAELQYTAGGSKVHRFDRQSVCDGVPSKVWIALSIYFGATIFVATLAISLRTALDAIYQFGAVFLFIVLMQVWLHSMESHALSWTNVLNHIACVIDVHVIIVVVSSNW
jgi:hypothetical protein